MFVLKTIFLSAIMFLFVFLLVVLTAHCGRSPNPLIQVGERDDAGEPERWVVDEIDPPPAVEVPPTVDAGEVADAGEEQDAGEPDAGTSDAGDDFPWSDCARHKKAQGHGEGLEKSCL